MKAGKGTDRMRCRRENNLNPSGCAGSSVSGACSVPTVRTGGVIFEKMIPHRRPSSQLSCWNQYVGQVDVAERWNDKDGEGIPVTVCRNRAKRKTFQESTDRACALLFQTERIARTDSRTAIRRTPSLAMYIFHRRGLTISLA